MILCPCDHIYVCTWTHFGYFILLTIFSCLQNLFLCVSNFHWTLCRSASKHSPLLFLHRGEGQISEIWCIIHSDFQAVRQGLRAWGLGPFRAIFGCQASHSPWLELVVAEETTGHPQMSSNGTWAHRERASIGLRLNAKNFSGLGAHERHMICIFVIIKLSFPLL